MKYRIKDENLDEERNKITIRRGRRDQEQDWNITSTKKKQWGETGETLGRGYARFGSNSADQFTTDKLIGSAAPGLGNGQRNYVSESRARRRLDELRFSDDAAGGGGGRIDAVAVVIVLMEAKNGDTAPSKRWLVDERARTKCQKEPQILHNDIRVLLLCSNH